MMGCTYCEHSKPFSRISNRETNKNALTLSMVIKERKLCWDWSDGRKCGRDKSINFCPMCGRKLKDDAE